METVDNYWQKLSDSVFHSHCVFQLRPVRVYVPRVAIENEILMRNWFMDRTATPDTVVWKLSSRVESTKATTLCWFGDSRANQLAMGCTEASSGDQMYAKENLARKFVSALPLIELYFLEEFQELCHACMRISLWTLSFLGDRCFLTHDIISSMANKKPSMKFVICLLNHIVSASTQFTQ